MCFESSDILLYLVLVRAGPFLALYIQGGGGMTNFDNVKITISDVFEAISRTNLAGYIFWGGVFIPRPPCYG